MRVSLTILTVVFALSSIACVNRIERKNSNGNNPPAPFADLEVCYNDTSSHPGFIRVGSKQELRTDCPQTVPGHLNIFVFRRYDNLAVGSVLVVCADQAVPTGWYDISGGYRDAKGCDAVAYPDPAFANVRKIYRSE